MTAAPQTAPRTPPRPHRSSRSRRRRWRQRQRQRQRYLPLALAFAGVVLALAVVGVVGVLHAIRLEHRLSVLEVQAARAQSDAESGNLAAAGADLAAAQATLSSVSSTLYDSPDFKVLDLLPVARQNLAASRAAVALGLQVVSDGQQILRAAGSLEGPDGHLDVSLVRGQIPLAAVQRLRQTLAAVVANLPASPPRKGSLVLGQVYSGEARVFEEAVSRRRELGSVGEGLALLNELGGGDGDRRYLVAVANEAEMRGAGGMILSYGVLTSHAGRISLTHVGPIDELALRAPAPASFPADFTTTYGALEPTESWRNATLMSDFTVDAPVLESMYRAATGLRADGVIQVDSTGLAALLAGTGPVATPDLGVVTSANAVPLTLNQAYIRYPDRPVRQEYLAEVANLAFAQLTGGTFPSLRPLASALVGAARGRHIQLFSSAAPAEATIRALGFDGGLPAFGTDFGQLTVQNFGGDKMDYYVSTAMRVTGVVREGVPSDVTVEVDVADTAPPGGRPAYIFGPTTNRGDPPGEYRGLVTVYLPRYTFLRTASGDAHATPAVSGSQDAVGTVTWTVALPPGGSSRMVLRVQLPAPAPGRRSFALIPQPRINATNLVYESR